MIKLTNKILIATHVMKSLTEVGMKSHEEIEPFKCNKCEKEFYVLWRLKKHMEGHTETQKYCHYYNNQDVCPYSEISCKFKHEDSSKCRFDKNCRFKLCQFKHSKEGIQSVNNSDDGSNKEEINAGGGLDKSKDIHGDHVNATNGDKSEKDNTNKATLN